MSDTVSESTKQSNSTGKNLVVCCDGTGNRGGVTPDTNVYRVFCGIQREKVSNQPQQIAYYDDGVGTEHNKYLRALGGAMGFGFTANVEDAYRFLCRNWEPGDRIYLFGFSRGAYTVRALGALIISAGIISGRNLTHAQLDAALKGLRKDYGRFQKTRRAQEDRRSRNDGKGAARRATDPTSTNGAAEAEPSHEFKSSHGSNVELRKSEVQFIGVWDTVSALGLPFDVGLKRLCEPLINCYRFVDNYLSDRVHLGRQVLSLDDQRYTFHPEVWNQWKLLACDGKQSEVKKAQAAPQSQDGGSLDQSLVRRAEEEGAVYVPCTNVDQAWFSGVHSNVGGGYPKRGMDYVTLQWMLRDLKENHQLRFNPSFMDEVNVRGNVHGRLYDSRSGLASYYRYRPRGLREAHGFHRLRRRSKHEPNDRVDWANATLQPSVNIHESALERIDARTDGYDVGNLPADVPVKVVGWKPQRSESQQLQELQELQRRIDASREQRAPVQRNAEAWFHRREALHLTFIMMNLFLAATLLHMGLRPRELTIPNGPLQASFYQQAEASQWLLHYVLPLSFVAMLGWVTWELRGRRWLWCIPLAAAFLTLGAVTFPTGSLIGPFEGLDASTLATMKFILPDIVAHGVHDVIAQHPGPSLMWVLSLALLWWVRGVFREKSKACFESMNQKFRSTYRP